MKLLKQVALVTAVAAASGSAFAMEALSDEALSQKTGQDGLTIKIKPDAAGITIQQVLIHDNDGLDSAASINYNGTAQNLGGTATAGAIIVNNLKIAGGEIAVGVDADAGAGGADPFLNASVSMAGTTTISLDGVQVGASGTATPTYNGTNQRGATAEKDILGALSLAITDASVNVQLGAQPQGAMALMDATLTGGLSINTLEVIDDNGGTSGNKGGLFVQNVTMTDAASADMSLSQKINIDGTDGIEIEMNSPTGGYYAYLTDVGISNGAGTLQSTIGDVELIGLSMGSSKITIAGK